jgi:hypothetical protein
MSSPTKTRFPDPVAHRHHGYLSPIRGAVKHRHGEKLSDWMAEHADIEISPQTLSSRSRERRAPGSRQCERNLSAAPPKTGSPKSPRSPRAPEPATTKAAAVAAEDRRGGPPSLREWIDQRGGPPSPELARCLGTRLSPREHGHVQPMFESHVCTPRSRSGTRAICERLLIERRDERCGAAAQQVPKVS